MSSSNFPKIALKSILILIFPILFQILGGPAAAFSGKDLLIGEINPLSGHLAQHGLEIHQGILYAVAEINSQGGLAGRRVRLISRDDQSRPEVAINQAQDLIFREHVIGLVGGYVDSLVGPVSELAARYRVPFVASASLQSGLTAQKNPYFFRVSCLMGIVQPLCRFLSQTFKGKKAAVLHVATPGATEFTASLKSCLEKAGDQMAVQEKFRPGWPDFSVLLLKVKQAGIDVLVSGGFYADNLILVRQIKERPLGLQAFIAPWGLAYSSFIRQVGQGAEGLFGACAWNPGITQPGTEKMSQEFVIGFRQQFGEEPNTTAMHGYTSARAMLAAIGAVLQSGAAPTGEAISKALAALDLKLPMERLVFDAHGDPKYYQHVVVQIQQQKMVVVYPPDRATGKVDFSLARR
ncbi:MAG: ABC transporter substrate-binding protein [Thermodesulfobacteriota bacterium]